MVVSLERLSLVGCRAPNCRVLASNSNLLRVARDAGQVQAIARAFVVRQVAAQVRAARRKHKPRGEINAQALVQYLRLAEGGPAVLGRVCLEVGERSVAWNGEERDAAHRVVKG